MNFHKTIGFLATLLLVLGLGVPDSFAQDQDPTIAVKLSKSRITEGDSTGVTVTVTLSEKVEDDAGAVTVTVALPAAAEFPTGTYLVVDHADPDNPGGRLPNFPTFVIPEGGTMVMHTVGIKVMEDNDDTTDDDNYNHPKDKKVTITATAADYTDGTIELVAREDDPPKGAITLTADPLGLSVGGSGQTVALTAKIAAAPGAANTVTVTFTAVHSSGTDGAGGTATEQTITGTAKEAEAELTGTTVDAAGSVTVTANAVGYTPGMVKIQIIDRNAGDAEGFRVTIISHADGAWVGAGAKKVDVEVRRLNRFAWDWPNFETLVVALRDTSRTGSLTGLNIYTLTVNGFAEVDEDITFLKGAPTGQGATANNTAITYSVANDALKFEFHLQAIAGTINTAEAILGTDTNTQEQTRINMGQRHGVYATATFTHDDEAGASTTTMLSSNDVKGKVYTSPAALATLPAAEQTVGDGKLLKIDLLAPSNIAVDNLEVTRKDEVLEQDAELKIGDTIEIAVAVDAQSRFRNDGVQVQIVSLLTAAQNSGTVVGKANRALFTKNFSQVNVIGATGKTLETSWSLTEGLIKLQANAESKTRDGANIAEKALFEPDNAGIRIRVRTKDQAGNLSSFDGASLDLIADTRKPVIDVLYPAEGDYFSGAIEGTDIDQFLKPLKIRVDEPVNSMDIYVHKDHKINRWTNEDQNTDLSSSVGDAVNSVGDTIVYDTQGLKINAAGKASAQGGSKVNLVIEVTDLVGNKTTKTLADVFHDEKSPEITSFFPNNDLLEGDDNQINDATRHPVFTLKEAVDSLAIVYDPSIGADIVHVVADGLPKGEHQAIIADPFVHDRTYTLTIFARDLAGNAFETPADAAADLKFNENFDNPIANAFEVEYAETDSVIAGQVNDITIQAYDNGGTAADSDDRNALTHKGAAMISAWDMASGGKSGSVRFHGGGVTDNGDGSAMLNAAAWKLGKRTVKVMSNKNIGLTKLLVQNLMDGEGGTTVPTFEGAVDSFYVGAADFVGFEMTAWQDGNDVSDRGITDDFDLLVVPVDRYGNPSVRAYPGPTGKQVEADSLAILDTRIKAAIEYKNGIDVTFVTIPALEELSSLFVYPIEKGGTTFPILLPEGRRSLVIQVRVENDNLSTAPDSVDMRSRNIRSTERFNIVAALEPVLTLWVPGYDMDQAGNDVVIPADPGDITVTVAATGYNAGSMVTFTKDGTALDAVAADDDGVARLMITMSAAGSVTVSATDGDWPSDDLTITFVEGPDEPVRMAYVDDMGMPVYLITSENMMVDVPDFLAFVAAYGSSSDADNYNIQADIDDDGDVDIDDFLAFISSYDRTAVGPATKPIVLLPGINENAEFSLNLGSERVVAGELVAVDVSLANVAALMGYGFVLNYEMDKFEFISVAPADEDLLTSTGGETLFHHVVADGQVSVATGMYNGTAVSGGGDIVRFVFRVLREFEDNARFEIANGLVFDPSQLQNPAVVAGVLELQSTPREFALHQNFPNPFNPDTTIKYDLAESADVTLQIYNVLGQVVRTLVVSEAQNAGRYQIRWNGMDDRGVPVSSGIYFYQISADGKFSDVRKLMLLK